MADRGIFEGDPRYTLIEGQTLDRDTPEARLPRSPDPATAAPDDADHPLDSETLTNLHRKLLAYYASELDVQTDPRAEMREDERFYDGIQWDEGDASVLRARGQVPLVFNVVAPAINWMLGTERQNRVQYKILPREKSDGQAARLKTELMKYVDDANNAEYSRSRAFADAVKCGIGWLEEGWQGDSGEEPVFVRYESWRNILWDSRAQELDLSDARYLFRAKWTDIDVASRLFRGGRNMAVLEQAAAAPGDLIGGLLGVSDTAMDEAEHAVTLALGDVERGTGRRRVRLIEGWYRVHEERPFLKGGAFSGEIFDMDAPGHLAALQSGEAAVRWRTTMAVRCAIFTSSGILWEGPSPYRHNRFPFSPVWGNRRAGDNMPYGLIRPLKDIQRDINKRHSKATHILNSSKTIMDEGAVDDLDEFAEEVARPDSIIVKKAGKELILDHGKELAPAQLELMARSIQMIQQTSGITDEAMGRQTNATSGKAILARQSQGIVATAHFLDNFRLALRISGEKQLSLIEQFYSEEKSFRITNKRGGAEYMQINDDDPANDILRTKADFVIGEDAWRATQRQAALQELTDVVAQLGPVAPELIAQMLDLLVQAMDIPYGEEIVARIRKVTGATDPDMTDEEKAQDPELIARAQAQAQQAEMAQRAAQAEIAKIEAEAEARVAAARKAGADAERAAAQTVNERITAQKGAIEAAVALLQTIAAAPVADALMDEAEAPTPPRPVIEAAAADAAAQAASTPEPDPAPVPAPAPVLA